MSHGPELLGAVLAGGRSRRFGRDKATEPVGGVPLVERAAQTLEEVCGRVVIVSSRAVRTERPTIPDLRPSCGPLGGIEAALHEAGRLGLDGAFVLACDLPLVTPDTVRMVADALDGVDAAAPARDGEPPFEPLCAAYRVSCLERATRLLDAGVRSAHALIDALRTAGPARVTRLDCSPEELLNVNEQEDRRRAEARLGRG